MNQELIHISPSLAKDNYLYCKDTMALKLKIEGSFIVLGKRLLEIRDKKRYLPNYESFEDFIIDIKLDPATASKLIKIYEHFVVNLKITPKQIARVGSWTNVYEVIKVSNNKKEAEEWLNKAKELTKADLRKEMVEEQTGINEKNCKHNNSYSINICRICGRRIQLYEKGDEKK